MAPKTTSAQPWFKDGLHFECTRCGRCCGGAPGFVWVTDPEIEALARRLGLGEAEFRRRYTRHVQGYGISLTETEDYDCVFFDRDNERCSVYEERPRQCRTYPFWGKVLASPTTWEMEAEECPGVNHGRRWGLVQIRSLIRDDGLPS